MGLLRDRMEADLKLRSFRPRTQETYVACARKLAAYYMRPPAELSEDDVRGFLVHLVDEVKVSPSTQKVYVASLGSSMA